MRSTCLQPRTAAHAKSATRRTRSRKGILALADAATHTRTHGFMHACTHALRPTLATRECKEARPAGPVFTRMHAGSTHQSIHALTRKRKHALRHPERCTHARARALAQLEIAWSRRLFSVVAAPDFFGEDGIFADDHIRTYTVRARSGTQTAARKTNQQRAKRPALRDTGARRLARAQRTDAFMLCGGAPDRPNESEPSPPARRSRQSRTRGGRGCRCVR